MRQVSRLVAVFAGLAVFIGLCPVALAGPNNGLCNATDSRGKIPDNFPIDACFDGTHLYFMNKMQFPVAISVQGDGAGQPERSALPGTVGGASFLLSFIRPSDFGMIPPGYRSKVRVGKGATKVSVGGANKSSQMIYLLSEVLWRYTPGADVPKNFVDMIVELSQVGDQYIQCLKRNTNTWGDLGCSALQVRNVSFALGRALAKGLAGSVAKAVIALFETARWADAATSDVTKLALTGAREFTLAAVVPQPAPTAAPKPQPPAPPKPPQTGGAGSGAKPGTNNLPPVVQPPAPSQPRSATAVVQNKHLEGASALGEDSTPAYLSTQMTPRCAANGCKIGGTDMWSGATFTALCWADGTEMTNENRGTPVDDNNPHKITTTKWYRGVKNGQEGYISFIYVTPGSRNLGLSHC